MHQASEGWSAMKRGNGILSDFSWAKWSSILEEGTLNTNEMFPGFYPIFTYDVPHNLHLIISLMLKLLTRYLQSDFAYSESDGAEYLRKPVGRVGKSVL